MSKKLEVETVSAFRVSIAGQDWVYVHASGFVPTSGWSNIQLSPTYYVLPPADGVWQLTMSGDAPSGIALQVVLPVSAGRMFPAPDWLKGVSVNGVKATFENKEMVALDDSEKHSLHKRSGHTIVRETIASYDDSFNPIGLCGGLSIKMKKLSHTLSLVVEGPDEGKIRECISQAAGVGLVAAIVAVYATGGGALSAAASAFMSSVQGCLGDSFQVRLDDDSHWVEWCT